MAFDSAEMRNKRATREDELGSKRVYQQMSADGVVASLFKSGARLESSIHFSISWSDKDEVVHVHHSFRLWSALFTKSKTNKLLAFLSLDPEITTLEPQLETARVWTTMPPVQEAEAIAFLPTLMSTTTEETTAVTSTTLYNNDGSEYFSESKIANYSKFF